MFTSSCILPGASSSAGKLSLRYPRTMHNWFDGSMSESVKVYERKRLNSQLFVPDQIHTLNFLGFAKRKSSMI